MTAICNFSRSGPDEIRNLSEKTHEKGRDGRGALFPGREAQKGKQTEIGKRISTQKSSSLRDFSPVPLEDEEEKQFHSRRPFIAFHLLSKHSSSDRLAFALVHTSLVNPPRVLAPIPRPTYLEEKFLL